MIIDENKRQQIKNILCEIALEAVLLQNEDGAVDDISRKVMQEADTKSRRIANLFEQEEKANTCHQSSNKNEEEMVKDDNVFLQGYKRGFYEGEKKAFESIPKEFQDWAKNNAEKGNNVVDIDEELKKDPASLKNISDLQHEISGLKEVIVDLQEEFSDTSCNISGRLAVLERMKSSVSEGTMKNLKQSVNLQTQQLGSFQERIKNFEQRIKTMEEFKYNPFVTDYFKKFKADVEKTLSVIGEKFTDLKGHVEDDSSRIYGLEGKIQNRPSRKSIQGMILKNMKNNSLPKNHENSRTKSKNR